MYSLADIFQFRHPLVRDLAWCCFSPSLLQQLPAAATADAGRLDIQLYQPLFDQQAYHWLQQLDADPATLTQHMASQKSHFLGARFEQFWRFYWQCFPGRQLLAHNLQVNQINAAGKQQTLGEFDFIVRQQSASLPTNEQTAETLHMETAVKFYLGTNLPQSAVNAKQQPQQSANKQASGSTDYSDWSQWIGPNAIDRLDLKLNRLLEHQLPLGRNATARQQLQETYDIRTPLQPLLGLRGYFFYPAHQPDFPPPYLSHPQHCRGQWFYRRDFINQHKNAEQDDRRWQVLDKPRWLSTRHYDHAEPPSDSLNHRQIDSLIEQYFADEPQPKFNECESRTQDKPSNSHRNKRRARPLLIAELQRQAAGWQEINRSFIVADDWPTDN